MNSFILYLETKKHLCFFLIFLNNLSKYLFVIGVSLDRTKEQWEQAIEDDNLPWTQVSNLSFWNDPVARRYSIRAIPQSYLIDNTGTVIGKNLRGNDLEERIKFALSLND